MYTKRKKLKDKIQRGSYGYINTKRKNKIINLFALFLTAVGIFVLGLFLNKFSKANVFTIVAVLFVLPWAKVLTTYILMFPYHTPKKEEYTQLEALKIEGFHIYSDLIITSEEKVMNLDFVVMGKQKVYGVLGKEGQDLNYINNYLRKGIGNYADGMTVKIVKDFKQFLPLVKEVYRLCKENPDMEEEKKEQQKKVEEYLISLIVQ